MRKRIVFILLFASLSVAGCASTTVPPEALQLKPESLNLKQLQTRRFDGIDEKKLLLACAGVIQDLGFNLEESETGLGVLVGSKERDAIEGAQVAASIAMAILVGSRFAVDTNQKIRASIVTRKASDDSSNYYARVTFQRIVWNEEGKISRQESIEDPEIYQGFFASLSKAVFLEANEI